MSRALWPKQLLPLVSEKSMLQETVARVTGANFAAPLIVCNDDHRFMIAEQMREIGTKAEAIVLEPIGRNTAPAVIVAALLLAARDANAVMLVLPSDHVIRDLGGFNAAILTAVKASRQGALVTFGIMPTAPETGYGYIHRGRPYDGIDGCYHIERFVEKPDAKTAEAYLSSGEYAWNSGMFVLPVTAFLEEARRLKPEMVDLCGRAVKRASRDLDFLRLDHDAFAGIEAISIDYAIMEQTDKGAMVPADIGWNDVGSWSALWDISEHDASDNVIHGDVFTKDTRNCYVRSEGKLIAAVGVEDLIVVGTDDAVLVVSKDHAQDVKDIVEQVERAHRSEHYVHTRVFRPWGWYKSINEGSRFQVKEILVNPGHRLSYQMHHHRAEHWIVVSGTAKVARGNETFYITEVQSTYIPHNTRHSLENPGKIPLRMIEVQSGAYVGEDDIVRFEDSYGRAGWNGPAGE
jgi:mannose-1-phosphate guanylyltransferase/mannose-6-phosphate isomerase